MIKLFQELYLNLADQIGIKEQLLKRMEKYPFSKHVSLDYADLVDYTNLDKSLRYGSKAFSDVVYIDFKKFISNASYYYIQEKVPFKKSVSVTLNQELYNKLFDYCLLHQINNSDAITQILRNYLN